MSDVRNGISLALSCPISRQSRGGVRQCNGGLEGKGVIPVGQVIGSEGRERGASQELPRGDSDKLLIY